jgi:hypothetical protein
MIVIGVLPRLAGWGVLRGVLAAPLLLHGDGWEGCLHCIGSPTSVCTGGGVLGKRLVLLHVLFVRDSLLFSTAWPVVCVRWSKLISHMWKGNGRAVSVPLV